MKIGNNANVLTLCCQAKDCYNGGYSDFLGSTGHRQLLEMIHEDLKTHVVCKNRRAGLLCKHIGKCDSVAGVSNTILGQAATCLRLYKTASGTVGGLLNIPHLTPCVHVVMCLRRIHFGQEETGLEGKM